MDESETATLQPETEPRLQIVYILTNPSMPGLVKIGRTTNLEARIASLSSSTSVPEAFEVAYAAYVDDASFVERAMHAAFSLHRMPGREFFRLPVANAIAALSLAEVEQVEINEETADGEQIIEEIRDRGLVRSETQLRANLIAKEMRARGEVPKFHIVRNEYQRRFGTKLPKVTAHRACA